LQDAAAAQQLPLKTTTHSAYYRTASVAELLLGFFHYYVHVFDQERSVVSIHREGSTAVDKVNFDMFIHIHIYMSQHIHIYISQAHCLAIACCAVHRHGSTRITHHGCDDVVTLTMLQT
jgi:Cid1 family poly A polymerase